MKQPSFFESDQPVVVFRYRQSEGRVEVRWHGEDLCATFQDWPTTFAMLPFYEKNAGVPFAEASVRVRT